LYSAPEGPMRFLQFVVFVSLVAASSLGWTASSYIVPTTTLAAQTSNNTSAANTFQSQTNGNLGAGNVSKVDVHTLLYSGATTKVYAHLLLWFGESNHMNVGYSSTNPNQIENQINDMISRGIDGVFIDWYGPGNTIDQATQLVMQQAEAHPGFTFAIMIDQGAIEWDSCSGCSPQQALVAQLQYLENTYFSSPAYMTLQGQPVVTNFGIDYAYAINWSAVNSALGTHPVFLFQDGTGFTQPLSSGSYSWVMPTQSNYGLGYLASFYETGMGFPGEQTIGASYKGFNDSLASWGSGRVMSQQCGQTWLQTFSEIDGLYNADKQLNDLQLVTWNDYEEGTEIESGIGNCFSITGSTSGNTLQWAINGSESTVDHYNVYISTDGQNLMQLTDAATGNYSLNLCSFPIPNGSYQMFVQAIGKPSIANEITSAIAYNATCIATTSTTSSNVSFTASPSTVTIPAGQSGNFTIIASPQSGPLNSSIALSCSGLPSTLNCSFSPAAITPGSNAASSTLTISAANVAAHNLPRSNSLPIYGGFLFPVGLLGFAFTGNRNYRRGLRVLTLIAVASLGAFTSSCGGGSGAQNTAENSSVSSPAAYTVTIIGSSSAVALSTTVNVIVQ
jgi:hypothetical protein